MILCTVVVFLVIAVFHVGQAYAALCFTDSNTDAVCCLKNNGISAAGSKGKFNSMNASRLTAGSAGTRYYTAGPTITSSLFGKATSLKGLLICYDAAYGSPLFGVMSGKFRFGVDGV